MRPVDFVLRRNDSDTKVMFHSYTKPALSSAETAPTEHTEPEGITTNRRVYDIVRSSAKTHNELLKAHHITQEDVTQAHRSRMTRSGLYPEKLGDGVVSDFAPTPAVSLPVPEAAEPSPLAAFLDGPAPAVEGAAAKVLQGVTQPTRPKTVPMVQRGSEWTTVDTSSVAGFHDRFPDPAIRYAFELDPFQKRAVAHLEQGDNVLVTAHTSAGKTVVADYAIALAHRHRSKAIYTAPIKSLSNQKYREFKDTFGECGILTGDVSFNPTATIVVMTTEVLRSMLFKSSDMIREVEWVVFDECHYLNDPERGVVWEELIVLLPEHINIVMLSATVPNAVEFAEWVGRTRNRHIYVISTPKRPVPLEYSLWCAGEHYPIINAAGAPLPTSTMAAQTAFKARERSLQRGVVRSEKAEWVGLMQHLQKARQLPVIVFSFSRRNCVTVAHDLQQIRFTTNREEKRIRSMLGQLLSGVAPADRALPQVGDTCGLLERGVGVHHAGMLIFLKEAVEMLFAAGLIKVLMATETFAMGVNMPARTVVFPSLMKHDGTTRRLLHPSEFIQMAGRAGRRGLDTSGRVIIAFPGRDAFPGMQTLRGVIAGTPKRLVSQFHLSYSTILNLLRAHGWSVRDVMRRSFGEFHTQRDRIEAEARLTGHATALTDIEGRPACPVCGAGDHSPMKEFVDERYAAEDVAIDDIAQRLATDHMITPGRVIVTADDDMTRCVAVVLGRPTLSEVPCVVFRPTPADLTGPAAMTSLLTPMIDMMSLDRCIGRVEPVQAASLRAIIDYIAPINTVPDNINNRTTIDRARDIIRHALPVMAAGVTLTNVRHTDVDWGVAVSTISASIDHLSQSPTVSCPTFTECFEREADRQYHVSELARDNEMSGDDCLASLPDLEARMAVLTEMGYLMADTSVTIKGRAACEFGGANPILATEFMLSGVFTGLTPAEAGAVLSPMLYDRHQPFEESLVPRPVVAAIENLKSLATGLGAVENVCGAVDEALASVNPGLVHIAYRWASGASILEAVADSGEDPGAVVRHLSRLADACKDAKNASFVLGDIGMAKKFETAGQLIKVGVVAASSLYIR